MRKSITLSTVTLGLTLSALLFPHISRSQDPQPPGPVQKEDGFGFQIRDLHVAHQGPNVVSLTVLYRYSPSLKPSDYMDVNELRKVVLDMIHAYPNKTDYWEVYNARIADRLFARYYNQIDVLRVKLDISPDRGAEPFPRTSLVIRAHPGSAPLVP